MISPRFLVVLASIALLLPGGWSWSASGSTSSPAPAKGPGGGHVVPQHSYNRGEPGYNVEAARSFRAQASHGKSKVVFRGGSHSAPAAPAQAPATQSPISAPKVAAGPQLFNGLNKPGMPASLSGGETPPDSTGAIGPNNYVELDNSNITVYDRNLNFVSSTSIDTFIGAPSGFPFCDPQIQWDNTAGRWLMSFLYCNQTDTVNQGVFFAWSATADPSNLATCATPTVGCTAWCPYVFNETSTGTPYLFDFEKLGHSSNYLVLGGNLYPVTASGPGAFVTAQILWASLPANGDQSCPSLPAKAGGTTSTLLNGDGLTKSFTPVPVNTTSNASDVWVISAYDAGNNVSPLPQNKLAAWDLNSAGNLMQSADITSINTYSNPTSAHQLGSSLVIDTSDTRLTQAVGNVSAGIWTQHTVLDPSGNSEVDWYELVQSGSKLVLAQQGSIDTPGSWTFDAAISPRWDGNGAAIFYNVSSATTDPSIVAQVRHNFTPLGTFEPGRTTLATSSAADTDFSCSPPYGTVCRWGDYSGATPDPVHQTIVWGTGEINTATGSTPAWLDQNFALHVPQPPAVLAAPVGRADGRGDVALTWFGPQFEPDACPSFVLDAYTGGVFTGLSETITGPAQSAQFSGLTNGTTYTFTVLPVNCGLPASSASPQSASVVVAGITQAPPATPAPRGGVNPAPPPTPQPR